MSIDMQQLRKEIKAEESTCLYVYKDTLGYDTIGTGRLVDRRRGGGLSAFEADFLLDNDLNRLIGIIDAKLPWVLGLSDARQRALVAMAFQMGINGVLAFKGMLDAMKAKNFDQAADHALDSTWAKQTPDRARRVAAMIRAG